MFGKKKDYSFYDTNGIHIGTREASSVRQLGKDAEWAHRGNMDTFNSTLSLDEIVRAEESDTGRVVGWFNLFTGKFVSR